MKLGGIIGVSGVTGFLGRSLRKLAESADHEIAAVSLRSGMTEAQVEKVLDTLESDGVAHFIHLAWPASSTPNYKFHPDNEGACDLTVMTATMWGRRGLKFYGLGSAAEDHNSRTPYSKAKAKTRHLLDPLIADGALTWLRPYFVFDDSSWPTFISESRNTGSVVIEDDMPRDFIHVNDVASGILAAIEKGLVGEVNLASGFNSQPSELLTSMGLGFELGPETHASGTKTEPIDIGKLTSVNWLPIETLRILKGKYGKQ